MSLLARVIYAVCLKVTTWAYWHRRSEVTLFQDRYVMSQSVTFGQPKLYVEFNITTECFVLEWFPATITIGSFLGNHRFELDLVGHTGSEIPGRVPVQIGLDTKYYG